MAGVISDAAPDVVHTGVALAQSAEAQQSLVIEGPTAPEFPENSAEVIATYTVTGAAPGATVSWDVGGTDARRFTIDAVGALRFKSVRNYEKPNDGNKNNDYEVEVSAASGSDYDYLEVTVTVTDANEAPVFDLETARLSVKENSPANRRVGGALKVTDPDDGDAWTFSTTGQATDSFSIDTDGQIRVRAGADLDYENTQVLSLTAVVTDAGGLSDSVPVLITLTDADDPGIVTFSPASPSVGTALTATIHDDDGVTGRVRWRWHRAQDADDEFDQIDGATKSSYTPTADDEDYLLRATVTYEDNFEARATASATSSAVSTNSAPDFGSETASRSVTGGTQSGTSVGAPVTATDEDGDDVAYTLSGDDVQYFTIGATTGQIAVGAENLPDADTKSSYSIVVTATDEAGATDTITVTITATSPNAPPVISGPASVDYAENGASAVATYTATDPDGDDVTWSLAGTDAAQFSISTAGALSFKSAPDYESPNDGNSDNVYEVTVHASDGTLTSTLDIEITVADINESGSISGPASVNYAENGTNAVATYTAADPEADDITWSLAGTDAAQFSISTAGALSFKSAPDYESPNDGNKDNVYEVTVRASDGTLTSTLGVEITVADVNESGSISGPASVNYAENGASAVATYTATDPDGDDVTWSLLGTDAAQFSISTAGALSFKSAPDYESPNDGNQDNVYEVTVTASDGNLTAELDVEVTVTDVNEAVILTGSTLVTYPENSATTVAVYSATDPDGDGITWNIKGTDTVRFAISGAGGLTFNSSPDYEKPRDANKDNVYEVTVTASDGNLTAELDVEIIITNVNEAALIEGSTSVTYSENSTTTVAVYSATDPDGDGITWDVEGTDAARFTISATGALSFKSVPDYESPNDGNDDNVYEVTVRASDGNLTSTLDVTISVTNVNESGVITGSASVNYAENGTGAVETYTATDPEDDSVTWSIAGTDTARLSISTAGALSFKSAPDYESPDDANDDNVYEVTVSASDGNLTAELDVEITVSDINEVPSITGISSVTYPENSPGAVAVYSTTDPDGDGITWDAAGTDAARFTISATGELRFNSSPDYEEPSDANKDNVYKVTVTASDGSLTDEMDVEITVSDVNEVPSITGTSSVTYPENGAMSVATYSATDPEGDDVTWSVAGTDAARFSISTVGQLSFKSAPDYEKPRDANKDNVYEVTMSASDGNLVATRDVEVTVMNVNESAAIIGPLSVSYVENAVVPVATYSATDPEGDDVTWSVVGTDATRFSVSASGALSFESSPDYESPNDDNQDNVYEAKVTASDGSLTTELDIEITIMNVNEAASIDGPTFVTYVENDATTVAVYSATDSDGDVITWDITEADAPRFSIKATGELTFNAPPDYEKPRDANKDNVYQVTVVASDGNLESTLEVEVTVTDVAEAIITGPVTASYAENGTDAVATYSLVHPEREDGSLIEWRVVGIDAANFVIDNQGELAFVMPPNFEDALDLDADNTHEIRIVANDDGIEIGLDVVIKVTDANDAPRFPVDVMDAKIPENSCPGTHPVYRGIGGGAGFEKDEDGDPLTYALSGPDGQTFVIHPSTGYVALGPGTLLDFETSREPFMLRVAVSDGRDDFGNAESEFTADDHLDLTVMVSDVDEPPVFTEAQLILDVCGIPIGHEPDQLRRTVTAGASGGTAVGAMLSAIDPEGKPVHFRIVSQSDYGAFGIDSTSGQIIVAPDFSPRDARRVYTIRVAAEDGEMESHIEMRIAVAAVPRPTPEPVIEDSGTPNPESVSDAEVSTPVRSDETEEDPSTRGGSAANSARMPNTLDWPPVNLKQIEPVFVPVPRTVQVPLFGSSEVQDQTGRARLTAPPGALAVPYQVRLTQDEAACIPLNETTPPLDCVCVSVEIFDVKGEPLVQESLNRPAVLEIVLRTQEEAGSSGNGDERVRIDHDSVEVMMRQDDEQEWGYTHTSLREPADGSPILMTWVRSPGQYVALVTEPGANKEDSGSAAPLSFVKGTSIRQTQKTVKENALKRTVSFVYNPVAVHPEPEPLPLVSAEPSAWYMARLVIALLLDVTVALFASFLFYRFISQQD